MCGSLLYSSRSVSKNEQSCHGGKELIDELSDRQALHQAIFSKRSVVVVVVVVGLGGVGAKLARKGLPAGSWHWEALPKTRFF